LKRKIQLKENVYVRSLSPTFSPTVLTVALMLQCCVCRLSVVVCLWRYVLWLNG